MQTVTLLPISDVGPNDGTPTPSGPHYLNLQTNDGDTSFVTMGFAGFSEVCGIDVSPIPPGSQVLALRVRWTSKSGASLATGRAGLRIDGVYVFGAADPLPMSYTPIEETIAHPDGQPWTRERIAACFLAQELTTIEDDTVLPRPRFTELVALVDIIPPGHPHAGGQSRASRAAAATQAPRSSAQSRAPGASMASQAARSSIVSRSARAGAASQSAIGTVALRMPRAVTPADLPKLRLRFASQSPRAAVSGQAAHAAIAGRSSQGEGE